MKKKNLYSVIQSDFNERLLTGEYAVHHVFPGTGRRRRCEDYGFLVAIRPALHMEIHLNPLCGYDRMLREQCYQYWLEHIGDTEGFLDTFGMVPD